MSFAFKLSLLANFALAAAVAAVVWHDRTRPATRPAPDPNWARGRSENAAARPRRAGSAKLTPGAVAELEAMGFSRDVIVGALLEDFNRRSTQQVVALQKKYAPRLVPKREMIAFGRQNEEDRLRELKSALGEDGFRAWDEEQTISEMNQARPPGDELPMTDAEKDQAYRLQKAFDDKAKELQMAMEDGVADPADVGALRAQAQQALDSQLKQLLGEQRFAALRGNVDPTTQVYRTYGDLNPTPEQAAAAAQVLASDQSQPAALDDAMRQIFGAQAYDSLKEQNDPTYATLSTYAGAWNLNGDEVQSAYQSLHAFDDQANRLRDAAQASAAAGQVVDWGQVNTSILQARQQTEASLQNLLGNDRLQRLENNGLLPTP